MRQVCGKLSRQKVLENETEKFSVDELAAAVAAAKIDNDMEERVCAKLVLSVTSELQVHLAGVELGSEAWKVLRELNTEKAIANSFSALRRFHLLRMAAGEPFEKFFGRFSVFLSQLTVAGEVLSEKNQLFVLLNALPNSYSG